MPSLVAIVGAAVIAVVTIVVGLAMGWLQRLVQRISQALRRRARADHWAIKSGWFQGDPSAPNHFIVAVKCAPSRSFRRPMRMSVEPMNNWLRQAFNGVFPTDPEYASPTEQIRYSTCDANGSPAATALAHPNGLLEVMVPVRHSLDGEGRPVISIMDIAQPLVAMIQSIQAGAHHKIFSGRGARRRRLDWHIALSRALAAPSWTPWSDLVFPGRRPRGRATGMQPPTPSPGFGQEHHQSLRQSASVERILMPALGDLVERAGYLGIDGALDDIETALREMHAAASDRTVAT